MIYPPLVMRGNNNGGCGCNALLMPVSKDEALLLFMTDGQIVAAVLIKNQ